MERGGDKESLRDAADQLRVCPAADEGRSVGLLGVSVRLGFGLAANRGVEEVKDHNIRILV